MKKFSVVILLIIIAVSSIAVYTSTHEVYLPFGNSIYGRWESVSTNFDIEFFDDNTYTSSDSNYSGDYSITDDRIRLGGILMPDMTFTYKVKGDTLYFYDDDGDISQEFRRAD